VAKAELKGLTQAEVDEVFEWLTGFRLNHHLEAGATSETSSLMPACTPTRL